MEESFRIGWAGENDYIGYKKGIAYQEGMIYVTDPYNHKVLIYSEGGNYEGEIGSGGVVEELWEPWDIESDGERLYILDRWKNRVLEYQEEYGERQEQGE